MVCKDAEGEVGMRVLFWFRQDLRLHDNPGLAAAQQAARQAGVPLEALFIATPAQWQAHDLAPRRAQLLEARLNSLGEALAELGIHLHLLEVASFAELPAQLLAWLQSGSADSGLDVQLFANRELIVDEVRRDRMVDHQLRAVGGHCHWFDERCLFAPGEITTGAGAMFQVFTPFSRVWLARLSQQGFAMAPPLQPQEATGGRSLAWQPISLNYPKCPCEEWPVSEKAIRQRLWLFVQHKLKAYAERRDFPALAGTSQISPYLAMGALSVRQCLAAMQAALGHLPLERSEPGFAWLNELIWREFYLHLMACEPRLAKGEPFKQGMAQLAWQHDETRFAAWCAGMTGFPIVDAAMRCLAQTGWMHNRLRMIVASFLCKDLHLPWWWGERYFMQQLLDGELAANNGGWQWSAGTGADAAPWFRIFNPTTQGQKCDPQGEFIRTYLPELARVPLKQLHTPHAWLAAQGQAACYPAPIVDHAVARQITLALFQARGGP